MLYKETFLPSSGWFETPQLFEKWVCLSAIRYFSVLLDILFMPYVWDKTLQSVVLSSIFLFWHIHCKFDWMLHLICRYILSLLISSVLLFYQICSCRQFVNTATLSLKVNGRAFQLQRILFQSPLTNVSAFVCSFSIVC